jgi:hypothetical protein
MYASKQLRHDGRLNQGLTASRPLAQTIHTPVIATKTTCPSSFRASRSNNHFPAQKNMASVEDVPADRFSAVASFYGPGTVAAWLCTLSSLFITWCFSAEYSDKDTFSLDYVFGMAMPAVSSVHALYQILSPLEVSNSPELGARSLFTSQEPEGLKRAAAIEAALNVCETFSAAAVVLVFIAMLHGHVRRMLFTAAVGLLAFLPEAALLFLTSGLPVSQSNLSRPFLFNFIEVMIAIFIFLFAWGVVVTVILLILPLRKQAAAASDQLEQQVAMTDWTLRRQADDWDVDDIGYEWPLDSNGRQIRQRGIIGFFTMSSGFSVPFLLFTSLSTPIGFLGPTSYMSTQEWAWRLPFFIPSSATHITDLDQMVSLCTGVIALIWSMWDTFQSQKKAAEAHERKYQELKARSDNRRRHRQMNQKLKLLRDINEQLDQAVDGARRQQLIEVRETLANQMSLLIDGK